MELVKMKKTGELKVIEVVRKDEEPGENYYREVKVYNYEMLKAFNYEQVSMTSIRRCLEETLYIMSPTLPYTVVENMKISLVPIEKYLITISETD